MESINRCFYCVFYFVFGKRKRKPYKKKENIETKIQKLLFFFQENEKQQTINLLQESMAN